MGLFIFWVSRAGAAWQGNQNTKPPDPAALCPETTILSCRRASLSATPVKFQMQAAGSCPDQDLEEITAFSTRESPIYFFFELMGIQSIFASYQFSAS